MRLLACTAFVSLSLLSLPLVANDWTGFRGRAHQGVADAQNLPTEWDGQQNILWRTDLPGPGTSSPILLGDRIYLTCYTGYGLDAENPGNQDDLVRHVVCLDRASGQHFWTRDFPAKMPESRYQPGLDSMHGYASSTLATDGERLYAFFGASGLYCLDLEGAEQWRKDLGSGTHGWGSATTPLVYDDLVIVNASIESGSLVALDKQSGGERWRVEGIDRCWASPVLVQAPNRAEVVLNVPGRITAYEPQSGDELWRCDGCPDGYLCPSTISHEGVVYAIGARRNTAIAVRAGGSGDVTESHVLWRKEFGSNVCSPVYADGYLYWLHEKDGVFYCLDAQSGELQYRERVRPRPGIVYASPTLADGKIYQTSRENATYVFAPNPEEMEQIAVNTMPGDDSRTNASLAVGQDRLFLRTDEAIYCIGKE